MTETKHVHEFTVSGDGTYRIAGFRAYDDTALFDLEYVGPNDTPTRLLTNAEWKVAYRKVSAVTGNVVRTEEILRTVLR